MKHILKSVLILLIAINVQAQSNLVGINYQGVARDDNGSPLKNLDLTIRIGILESDPNGSQLYQESHVVTTDDFGLFQLVIGEGNPEINNFSTIDWAQSTTFLKIEIALDITNGFKLMGVMQLLAVPYAYHAKTAENVDDADADPMNEVLSIAQLSGLNLELSDAGGLKTIDLSSLVDDADADPTNEMQDLSIAGNTLSLTNDATSVDLSAYLDNTDGQTLNLTGTDLSISGGNTLDVSGLVDDADANPVNEIQDLNLSGSTLTITNNPTATGINLGPFSGTNTDEQDLALVGNTLSLTNDATNVDLSGYLDNTDNQDLTLTGNTLSLTNDATSVDLSGYLDNTDGQTLSITGTNLSISGGNSLDVSGLVNDSDADPVNELQDLSIAGNNLSLTNDASSVDLSGYLDNTDAQDLALTGNNLSLTNDASSVDLSGYLDNTDNQNISNVLTAGNDAGGKLLKNLTNPVDLQDAATKNYVDTELQKGWLKGGNTIADPATDYMGTQNNIDLVFATNATERLRIKSDGNIGFGISNPQFGIHAVGSTKLWGSGWYVGAMFDFSPAITTGTHGNLVSILDGNGDFNYSVFGEARGITAGFNHGVHGAALNSTVSNKGVWGEAIGVATASNSGVFGSVQGDGVDNRGVKGLSISSSLSSYGVMGISSGTGDGSGNTKSWGIFGEALNNTNKNFGVYGKATGAVGENYGVFGEAANGTFNWAGYFMGKVNISEVLHLTPLSMAPSSPQKGDMYFDNNDNKLKVWDGTLWQNCF